jgi:hypothetical protein
MMLARILRTVGSSDRWLAAVYKSRSGRNVLRPKLLCIEYFAAEKSRLEDMEQFLPSEIARLVYGNMTWLLC